MEETERIPIPIKKHNFITWMDGSDAAYWSDSINAETGMRTFEFKPTDTMRWKHQIREYEYHQDTGRIIKEYPDDLCINASSSANSIRWFIFCDYRGKETDAMKHMDKSLLVKITSLKKELEATKMALKIAQREAIKREAHRKESDKQVFERLRDVKKLVDNTYTGEQ